MLGAEEVGEDAAEEAAEVVEEEEVKNWGYGKYIFDFVCVVVVVVDEVGIVIATAASLNREWASRCDLYHTVRNCACLSGCPSDR